MLISDQKLARKNITSFPNISFDHCIKCGICNLYCPVYQVTDKYPGPKHSGPDAERIRIKNLLPADTSLNYCTNCKRCEIACPSGVEITDMIVRAKLKDNYHKNYLRDYILSHTDLVGSLSVKFSLILNLLLKLKPVKYIMEFTLAIDAKRKFPEYARKQFKFLATIINKPIDSVIYYHGCYAKYNDHGTAIAVTEILELCGIEVGFIKEKCCGVPLIANNFKHKAINNARHNIAALSATGDKPILVSSPSCLLALKIEYDKALILDNSAIKSRLQFITSYINANINLFRDKMKPLNLKIAYHAPCHLEKLGYAIDTIEFLNNIPGLSVHVLNSECCGISGTYGFKKENYTIAQNVGSRLFDQIGAIDPDFVITDCETCKMQIEMSTRYKVSHPLELLQKSVF